VLFAAELARRLEGRGVTSNSVHPGSVNTNIWNGAPPLAKPIIAIVFRPFFISPEKGATHVVALATRPDLEGVTGKYFEKEKMVEPAPLARDVALAGRLWDTSAAMVRLPAST
jgi:Dehydrogenases with different specificities (related to short-chain alcohol dehydrogenases)